LHDRDEGHSDFAYDEEKDAFGFKDGQFAFSQTHAAMNLLEREARLQSVGSPVPNSYHSKVHLASDYIHPTPRGDVCRIRIYLPEDQQDAPVVICSELPNNEGSSFTYFAHQLAAEVIRYHKLGVPPVWIEHYPKEATDGAPETFELVVFSSYEVKERAPYMGERKITLVEPTWKTLDRKSVVALVGHEV
jgi:hypothetical protein